MNISKYKYIVSSLIAGGLLLVGLFLLLNEAPPIARADPGNLFVTSAGSGDCSQANPCNLQTALSTASNGDTIYLAAGTYTGTGGAVITVTKSITLYGGWDGSPTGPVARDPRAHPTVLDGERQRRVVYIGGDITPTLDGLIITRGNATGLITDCSGTAGNPDGCGGGIFVYQAHPFILNNIITDNVAALTTAGYPTGTTGYGGGIYLQEATRAVISGNVVISNVASAADKGYGGGIALIGYGEGTVVRGNQVLNNWATLKNVTGWGGGIAGGPDGALIEDNLIQGNHTNSGNRAYGAGLYQWYGAAHYRRNRVIGNYGAEAVYLGYSRAVFKGNLILDNLSRYGIYIHYGSSSPPVLVNNIVARSGSEASLKIYGHHDYPLTAILIHNTLVGPGTGAGVLVDAYVTLTLTNTIVASHTVGITNTFPTSSTVYADHTLFWANTNSGISGTNPVFGNTRFLNPDGGDYHIGPGSAAIDAGVDAGVDTDIDGDPRPLGTGYDIGADEAFYRIYLPLVMKNFP